VQMENFAQGIKRFTSRHPYFLFLILGTFHRDTCRRLKKLIRKHDLILDIGALDSPYSIYFSNQVVAVDLPSEGRFGFSMEILRELKLRRNVSAMIASTESLPFKAKSFDRIVCTEVLEHVYHDRSAVCELARVLKVDGKSFLTTPNQKGIPLQYGIKEHVRHYSENGLNDLLSEFFGEVVIEKRFRLWCFLRASTTFWNRWIKNRYNVFFFLGSLLCSWMYDLVYLLEKLGQSNDSEYNLLAVCSESIESPCMHV